MHIWIIKEKGKKKKKKWEKKDTVLTEKENCRILYYDIIKILLYAKISNITYG
jgi:hypothetical protein